MAADSKAKLLQDAERYVLQGKIQQAISEYLKIVQLDPNDVLILNTVGDLYLRQRNSVEANKYFSQVAENYVQNNFFLKAIAVYKKILSANPSSLDINLMMASLYAKQGLSIDARNQYMRVADLFEKGGKTKETLEAYEKIVELDPSNAAIQRKLAQLHLAEGAEEKAQAYWAGAARAQVRAGDMAGAVDSFKRAIQLSPADVEVLKGFLDCCIKMENVGPALDQLKKSMEMAPDNLDLREMLGRAHLANNDPEAAAKAFQVAVSMDESRYQNLFPVAQAFIDKNSYDQALSYLDSVVPILISRRETERAAKLYETILQRQPKHVATMTRLASLYSAIGDQHRYTGILDEIADYYLSNKNPIAALEFLDKILQTDPESEKHRNLHHQAFTEAYPDTPYVPPALPPETVVESAPALIDREPLASAASDEESPSAMVEVDLLLNYGLRDKALSLLQSHEARDPYDKEVRIRLLSLYKSEKKYDEAAEQCLLLAALHRRAKNEESAQTYLAEAKQLSPDVAEYEKDLEEFARRNGIVADTPAPLAAGAPDSEVDLSSDLLDIFFTGDQESMADEDSGQQPMQEIMAEGYPQDIPPRAAPSKPVLEQLQEVDFYIRLGFHDEALAKLNEIAKISPDNPELASRYQKLGEIEQLAPTESAEPRLEPVEAILSVDAEDFNQLDIGSADDGFAEAGQISKPLRQSPSAVNVVPFRPAKPDFKVNEMFADLMEEVSSSGQEAAKASFEEHFNLGTAYREMDLIEDAIREFQDALRAVDLQKGDPKVIQCCGMLSTCFLKKNMPRSALRWCQAGLGIADISSHEAMALRYDMGIAHLMDGSNERALECFDQLFNMDPGYRDVAQRIDELKSGFEGHTP